MSSTEYLIAISDSNLYFGKLFLKFREIAQFFLIAMHKVMVLRYYKTPLVVLKNNAKPLLNAWLKIMVIISTHGYKYESLLG